MTTRIELGGEGLSRWLEKHQVKAETEGRFTVAEIADEAGIYDTAHGQIGIDFSLANTDTNYGVVIDCRELRLLQGKGKHGKREERIVHVNREGIGSHQLAREVDLFVSTGASRSQFREK